MFRASLKDFNITTDEFGFYKLTYKGMVMGRFSSYKQATSHKLGIIGCITADGRCRSSKRNDDTRLTTHTELAIENIKFREEINRLSDEIYWLKKKDCDMTF